MTLFFGMALLQASGVPSLRPPHPELQPSFWQQYGWLLLIAFLIVAPIPIWWALWFRRAKPEVPISPCQIARQALEALRNRPEDGTSIVQATQILRRCAVAVLDLPPQELTTSEFRLLLGGHGKVSPDLARQIIDFLQRCDELKFAPAASERRTATIDEALALMDRIASSARI